MYLIYISFDLFDILTPVYLFACLQMSFPLQAAGARANLDALPHIRDFIQRVEARPAYQRGIERTGPLELLG